MANIKMESNDRTVDKLLNAEGAGEMLGCPPRQVRVLDNRGVLPAVRLPGSRALRFRTSTLRRITESNETPPPTAA